MSEANRFVQVVMAAQAERARRQVVRETQERIERARVAKWMAMVRDTEGRPTARGRA
jgi:hypothetical protein